MKRLLAPFGTLLLLLLLSIALTEMLGGERPIMNMGRHLVLGGTGVWMFAEAWKWASFDAYRATPPWFRTAMLVAGSVCLGVGWEIFEWRLDLVVVRTDVGSPYDDTIKDLLMDIVGAALAVPLFWRK